MTTIESRCPDCPRYSYVRVEDADIPVAAEHVQAWMANHSWVHHG